MPTLTSDPVKCDRCGFYVNPDMHDEQACAHALDEVAAERARRRAEWWD